MVKSLCQLKSGVELAKACEVDVELLINTNRTQETTVSDKILARVRITWRNTKKNILVE